MGSVGGRERGGRGGDGERGRGEGFAFSSVEKRFFNVVSSRWSALQRSKEVRGNGGREERAKEETIPLYHTANQRKTNSSHFHIDSCKHNFGIPYNVECYEGEKELQLFTFLNIPIAQSFWHLLPIGKGREGRSGSIITHDTR